MQNLKAAKYKDFTVLTVNNKQQVKLILHQSLVTNHLIRTDVTVAVVVLRVKIS